MQLSLIRWLHQMTLSAFTPACPLSPSLAINGKSVFVHKLIESTEELLNSFGPAGINPQRLKNQQLKNQQLRRQPLKPQPQSPLVNSFNFLSPKQCLRTKVNFFFAVFLSPFESFSYIHQNLKKPVMRVGAYFLLVLIPLNKSVTRILVVSKYGKGLTFVLNTMLNSPCHETRKIWQTWK